MIRIFPFTFLALCLIAVPAQAHTQSYGYLHVKADGSSATGRVELAVRDADQLISLDADGDGTVTWGEAKALEGEISSTLLSSIAVARGAPCTLKPSPLMIDSHGGETYLSLPFTVVCERADGPLMVGYDLMFTRDAQHRGLVTIEDGGTSASLVMSPEKRSATLDPLAEGAMARFLSFTGHGIHHIWIGFDHILFLLTLLLATALTTRGAGVRKAMTEAAKVVTAFTASHSLTLGLAATGLLTIPQQLTESLIALTIAFAAANNIWPVFTGRVWVLALAFGLVHGLGFASVLAELGLPQGGLIAALLAFNIGVEIGQLAIAAVALPLIYLAVAPRLGFKTMPAANLAIVVVGLAWFSDRALGTALMPF